MIDLNVVKQLRKKGFSTKEASKHLGITIPQLQYVGWHKLENPYVNLTGTYCKDTMYFDKIDTPNKAYILGFILADGCIYSNGNLRVEIHKKDVEILNFIKSEISPNSPIKKVSRIRDYKGYTWQSDTLRLDIKCKRFYYDLDHFGVTLNKTYNNQFLPNLHWRLMPHFIRGYFDGDGSVWLDCKYNKPCINFTGNHNLLNEIGDYLNYIQVLNKIYKASLVKNQNNSCLTVHHIENVKSFYDYIYKDGFYLKRKKEKFNYELA